MLQCVLQCACCSVCACVAGVKKECTNTAMHVQCVAVFFAGCAAVNLCYSVLPFVNALQHTHTATHHTHTATQRDARGQKKMNVAVRYSVCVAVCVGGGMRKGTNKAMHIESHGCVLQCIAVCVLQCIALCCSVLQCVCCNVCGGWRARTERCTKSAMHACCSVLSVLQCVAVCVLQCLCGGV